MKKLLLNTFGILAVFFTLLAFSSTASAVEKSFTITFKTSSNSGGTDKLPASGKDPIAISVESGTENISKLDDFNTVYAAGLYGLKIGTNTSIGAIGVYFATPVKATKIEVLASASNNPTGQKLDIAYKDQFKDPTEFSFNDTEVKDVYKTCVLDLDGKTEVAHVYLNKTNSSPKGYISIKSITVTYNEEVANPDNITPELTWSAKEVTAVLGDKSFVAPTLTFGPTDNAVDVEKLTKYRSSDTKVATIDNYGKLTLVGRGTTTITAYVDKSEVYNAQEASYTLSVIDPAAVPDEYVLNFDFTQGEAGSTDQYTVTWERSLNGFKWTMSNFSNYNKKWAYIKCGRKSAASVATITTATVMAYPVNEIDLTIDAITANSVNSITLLTSTSADFSNLVHSIDINIKDIKTAAPYTIDIPKPQANLYYRLKFDCKKSSNGVVTVSKVVYKLKKDNLGVNSIEETLALKDKTEVLINYPMTVAFRNDNNVFAVDAAGKFIQIDGSNSYAANDIIPAGWTGQYLLFNGNTPKITPVGALPEAVAGGSFVPAAVVDPTTVTTDMVNSVVLLKNAVIDADTPIGNDNFNATIAGNTVELRTNYMSTSASAGVYDITAVVNLNNNVSFYAAGYKAVPAFRINGELVTTTTFDANSLKITLVAVLPEGHQMWYRFTPVAAASSQAVTDKNGFTKYEGAFALEDSGKLEYYSVDPEGNKSEVYELRLDNVTGINDIVVDGDNSEAVYYNLQGVRVDNPNSGIYLVRRAGRVSKVFVK